MNVAVVIIVLCLVIIACFLPYDHVQPDIPSDSFQPTANPTQDIVDYQPNQPSPVDLYNGQPYHLLNDSMDMPRVKESLSCVNSRSCYATDFQRTIEKTGNYNQMTNNYKRNYPDSCSGLEQELTLNFYKVK
jgi:hypothetical protein